MSSAYPTIQSRPFNPHVSTTCSQCHIALEFPPPSPLPRPGSLLNVRCHQCSTVFSHAFYPNQLPNIPGSSTNGGMTRNSSGPSGSSGESSTRRSGRKIGTDERPLETGYYDLLGVPVDATTDDIKKAYREFQAHSHVSTPIQLFTGRLAIKFHPDKNRDDPNAEERFKEIAIAYQTLSDPALRKKYNEFGSKESAPDGGFVDPEEVFGAIFGGDRFIPIIGNISLAKDMKTALQEVSQQFQVEQRQESRLTVALCGDEACRAATGHQSSETAKANWPFC